MSRLLFIGHDASRSGAPFVLLYLLRWIKANQPDHDLDLLLLGGGELEEEYRSVANVYVVPHLSRSLPARLFRRLRGVETAAARSGKLPHFERNYDAVIGNTVLAMPYLSLFKRRGFNTISWLHELENAITALGLSHSFLPLADSVDKFIVGSNAVSEMLTRFGIKKPISRVYEFSPRGSGTQVDVRKVKKEMGVPDDAFIVGACGTLESRKGADIFADVAKILLKRYPEMRFVWVARDNVADDQMYGEFTRTIADVHLSDKVFLHRSGISPENYLAAMDVFVLPSREDPFPIVCLEAANLGKPIVCFADAGGMPEFVQDDAGAVVPFGDIEALADAIAAFYLDPKKMTRAGSIAKQKALGDFSTDTACLSIFNVIRSV
jgi:glycosyltransferase involved in cell wall biosynthesis